MAQLPEWATSRWSLPPLVASRPPPVSRPSPAARRQCETPLPATRRPHNNVGSLTREEDGRMRIARTVLLVLIAGVAAPAAVVAQDMAPPKPGPEHELFKNDAGTWDAVVEMMGAPGAPPMKSTGVETSVLGCGGLCLVTDFKGEMMPGQMFEGH